MRFSPVSLPKALGTLFLCGFMAAACATNLPTGVTQGPSIEGTTQYSLQNGLKVLLTPDDSKPTTIVNMTYLVGSRLESRGETGMAHLLEHMLFRGSPTMRDPWAEFSKRGLRANGSTNEDRTDFFASFAADPQTLKWYLDWQADAMVNSLISRKDLDSEMPVVRNEMEAGENSPFKMLLQKMQAAAYTWHGYGKATIGARSDVENVDIKQLRKFYHLYYQPDNAVLIVSGKFNPTSTLDVIASAFGKIPKPQRTLPPEYTVEPVQDGERKVVVRRHGGNPLAAALFHIPQAGSPDYIPFDLGVDIISDTPSGRLYHALVQKKLATSVFGFARAMREPGYALFGAELDSTMNPKKALHALNATLADVATQPFTQAELDRVKSKWRTSWSEIYADPVSLTGALSSASATGDWRLFFAQRDQMKKITLAQVQKVVQEYLVPSNRNDGVYIPADKPVRAPLPAPVDLAAELANYHGNPAPTQAAAFDPTPANIDAHTLRTPLDLPNGQVQLALLPKPTRGDRVEATLVIQFSDAEGLKGQRITSAAAAQLLDRGTTDMSRQAIQDRLDALEANLNFSGQAGVLVAGMSTTGQNLPKLVELALHIVRNANFPEPELAEFKRRVSASIESAMTSPQALAARALDRHDNPWAKDDVRYTPSFEEALKGVSALTREDLVKFHDKFYGTGTTLFAAVGSFDPKAVKAALSTGLKGWKKAAPYTRISDPYRAVPPELFRINTPDKANAVYMATLPLKIQDTDPRFAALSVANYLLGGSQTSLLWNRVRVKDGLSYTVSSDFDASSFEPSASWSLYATYAPQNHTRLLAAMKESLANALKSGFTDKEVKDAVESMLKLRQLARTHDGVLASAWVNYLQLGRDFTWSQHIDDALRKLTAADVNAALRETLKPAMFSTAIAEDSSKVDVPKHNEAETPNKDKPPAVDQDKPPAIDGVGPGSTIEGQANGTS
jgi:zinc protease